MSEKSQPSRRRLPASHPGRRQLTSSFPSRRQLLAGAAGGGAAAVFSGGSLAAALPAHAAEAQPRSHGGVHTLPIDGDGRGRFSPSGRQFEIALGDQRVIVTEAGAGLRSYLVGGQEFLYTFGADEYATGASFGQILIPFPNRIDHGRYTFEGVEQELPWTEPANQNAIHGLTRWLNWEPARRTRSRITLSLVLRAQPGYPFVLALWQDYRLTPNGLVVTNVVRNVGTTSAPYGVGAHPYLTVGTDVIDPATLRLPARKYFKTNDRLIPIPPAVPVDGTRFDFREPRRVGDTQLDTGFADLVRDGDGLARVSFAAPSGGPVATVWMDEQHEFLQVYTADTLEPEDVRRGIAIEPYTCATDAFNNGLGLRVLEPGEVFRATWGMTVES